MGFDVSLPFRRRVYYILGFCFFFLVRRAILQIKETLAKQQPCSSFKFCNLRTDSSVAKRTASCEYIIHAFCACQGGVRERGSERGYRIKLGFFSPFSFLSFFSPYSFIVFYCKKNSFYFIDEGIIKRKRTKIQKHTFTDVADHFLRKAS